MTCRELVELLIDFVSDELPPESRTRIEQHLRRCPPCEAYLDSYRATIRLTRQLPCAPIPPELKARLIEALQEIRQEQPPASPDANQ
jgi:anti-sigma factor RsiW